MNSDNNIVQDISLHNRKQLTITAVKKINSFNDLLFDIETGYGRIKIEGNNLDMHSLDIDQGVLVVSGTINKIEFLEKTKVKKDTSFIAKIFK